MLSSAPSVILSIPDEGYSRNLACALTLISTLLFKLLCHHDISVDSFRICWILIQFILHRGQQHFEIFILSIVFSIEMRNIAFLCSLHFCFAFC
jgi:hypothetical protein